MQALLMHSGDEAFGLDVRDVQEVVPMVRLRPLRWAPSYVAGLFSYRGTIVPVIDLCQISQGRSCEPRLSSRIVLVRYQPDGFLEPRALGILAERVTEIVPVADRQIQDMGVDSAGAPHLGKVALAGDNMVQFVRVTQLLPAEVRERLFAAEVANP